MGSTISSTLEDDSDAGYEADYDAHTTSRRAAASTRRARSRRASATVHYLVERVEPTIEVLAPITLEELEYLKAHTNIPIPAHYEAMLPKNENAGEASELRPSSASLSQSETPLDRIGCGVECTLPGTTSLPQRFLAELERQPQPDFGPVDESYWSACPIIAEEEAAVPSDTIFGLEVAGTLPATPDHLTILDRNNHIHPMHFRDLPPTPDLRPWLAVASGEPSPMVLTSPAMPFVIHAPRPRLTYLASCR